MPGPGAGQQIDNSTARRGPLGYAGPVLVALRVLKLLSVAAFVGGSVGAILCRDEQDRRRLSFVLVAPGFGLTWVAGFLLAAEASVSLLEGWVLGAMVASILSLQATLFRGSRPGRQGVVSAGLVVVPLIVAIGLMVWRPQ
jgi:energy-converting hydrogenase Eha subunit C